MHVLQAEALSTCWSLEVWAVQRRNNELRFFSSFRFISEDLGMEEKNPFKSKRNKNEAKTATAVAEWKDRVDTHDE